jgi:hypothetical protein
MPSIGLAPSSTPTPRPIGSPSSIARLRVRRSTGMRRSCERSRPGAGSLCPTPGHGSIPGNTLRTQTRSASEGCTYPRLRFLVLRCISFAPKGPQQDSPGQRPGWRLRNPRKSPERATHRRSAVAPLQGFFPPFRGFRVPRALPWADLSGPYGAKTTNSQHQNLTSTSSVESRFGFAVGEPSARSVT